MKESKIKAVLQFLLARGKYGATTLELDTAAATNRTAVAIWRLRTGQHRGGVKYNIITETQNGIDSQGEKVTFARYTIQRTEYA